MDRDEVINRIKKIAKHAVHTAGEPPFVLSLDDGIALKKAIAILEAQESLPIVYQDNPYTGLPVAHCPKCGKFARQYHAVYEEETKFCPYCGQEVIWE